MENIKSTTISSLEEELSGELATELETALSEETTPVSVEGETFPFETMDMMEVMDVTKIPEVTTTNKSESTFNDENIMVECLKDGIKVGS